jgi:hypothetical protein
MPGGHGTGDKPLPHQSVKELWEPMIFLPTFGGMLVSAPLLDIATHGQEWTRVVMALLAGGFVGTLAVVTATPRLLELHRRGGWVPPGTARHPVRVAAALATLLMAAGGGVTFALVGVARLSGLMN